VKTHSIAIPLIASRKGKWETGALLSSDVVDSVAIKISFGGKIIEKLQ
jgi:hypothetical protein